LPVKLAMPGLARPAAVDINLMFNVCSCFPVI
jgi:hypothetical protein